MATALQTIAVCGALIVAFVEWRGHESEDRVKKREAAIKLFVEQSDAVTKARQIADTEALYHMTFPVDQNAKAALSVACTLLQQLKTGPKETLYEQTLPLRGYLIRVQLCVRAEVCDAELSKALFCSDVNTLSELDKAAPNEKPPPVSLLKECAGYKRRTE